MIDQPFSITTYLYLGERVPSNHESYYMTHITRLIYHTIFQYSGGICGYNEFRYEIIVIGHIIYKLY